MAGRDREPLFGARLSDLRRASRRDMAIRFGFGVAISAVSAIVGITAGARAGGLLLAFPAILPATLTLIEKQDGEASARDDDNGAMLGALALLAFAVVGWQAFPRLGPAVAIPAATLAWLLTAVALYVLTRLRRR